MLCEVHDEVCIGEAPDGLNPYSIGICSVSVLFLHHQVEFVEVLILILLEYAL